MAIRIRSVKMFVCDIRISPKVRQERIQRLTASVTITADGCKLSVIDIGRESIGIPLSV
jgi:hypothetical protein